MAIRLDNTPRDSALTAIATAIDAGVGTIGGVIKVYTGDVHGTFGSAPLGTLITTVTLDATAFAAAANGGMVATLTTPSGTPSPSALVAGCFTVSNKGNVLVLDGNVTDSLGSGDLKLSDVNIGNGVILQIVTFTITAGNSPV